MEVLLSTTPICFSFSDPIAKRTVKCQPARNEWMQFKRTMHEICCKGIGWLTPEKFLQILRCWYELSYMSTSSSSSSSSAAVHVGKGACRLILTQKSCREKIPFRSSQKRLSPLSLSSFPLKQLTVVAETTSSGKEFHKFTILYPSTLDLKRPLLSLFSSFILWPRVVGPCILCPGRIWELSQL